MKQFVNQHRDEWKQLEQLISILHKRRKSRSSTEINEFHRLYQKCAGHLSYSQTYFPDEETTPYLNGLVSKAHNLLYRDQVSSFQQIRYFFSTKFIGLLLEQWKFAVAALLLFTLGGVGSFFQFTRIPFIFFPFYQQK